jgi:hypothetical protein
MLKLDGIFRMINKNILSKGGSMMKKLFFTLSVLVMIAAMICLHGVAVQAQETAEVQDAAEVQEMGEVQETAEAQEMAEPEKTASLQETDLKPMVNVSEMAICKDIVNREPEGAGESFDAYVGTLYCFTRIVGAKDPIEVAHVWYYGDTERATVNLSVRSSSWRTYSSKIIQSSEVGEWRVDVVGPEGEVLKSQSFNITQ